MARHSFAGLILGFLAAAVGPSLLATAQAVVSPEQVQQLEIALSPVKPATSDAVGLFPGTVVAAPNSRVAAAAPFAGTVVKVEVLPGQSVKAGAPLVTVLSRDLLEAQSTLGQNEAELEMAEAIARRKRDLASKNIMSPLLADEAEAQVRKLQAAITSQRRSLSLGTIEVGENGTYAIKAPADGKVVSLSTRAGTQIEAMSAAVTLSTSAELQVEVQLPVDLVADVKLGDPVEIGSGIEGTVLSVGSMVEPLTRSVLLLVSVPAGAPVVEGQLVTVTLKRQAETGSYEVPASAVAYINDGHAVFVRNSDGFSLAPVVLRGKSRTSATVTGDLTADQQVAASGLPQLEALVSGE